MYTGTNLNIISKAKKNGDQDTGIFILIYIIIIKFIIFICRGGMDQYNKLVEIKEKYDPIDFMTCY